MHIKDVKRKFERPSGFSMFAQGSSPFDGLPSEEREFVRLLAEIEAELFMLQWNSMLPAKEPGGDIDHEVTPYAALFGNCT